MTPVLAVTDGSPQDEAQRSAMFEFSPGNHKWSRGAILAADVARKANATSIPVCAAPAAGMR
jgi:hypothetical protein